MPALLFLFIVVLQDSKTTRALHSCHGLYLFFLFALKIQKPQELWIDAMICIYFSLCA
jgi:hypothetical protein